MPLTLTEEDLGRLHGQNEVMSLQEIEQVYLPLSRLLNLYVSATQSLHRVSGEFLGTPEPKVPYIIGVAGSVAVGKSTTSRVLKALLSRWPNHPNVVVLTTDGFLYSTQELERRDLIHRKGFPESYDTQALMQLLQDVKSGKRHLKAPVSSHQTYDIIPGEFLEIDQPDILIVEGLNILQTGGTTFVSDFFDFTVFVDADTHVIEQWYLDRVWAFCEGPFQNPDAYFHYLSKMSHEEVIQFARRVWREVNELNLVENVLPFKERARLILRKGANHQVESVLLRKL
jgi:type I pantothenate kinase